MNEGNGVHVNDRFQKKDERLQLRLEALCIFWLVIPPGRMLVSSTLPSRS